MGLAKLRLAYYVLYNHCLVLTRKCVIFEENFCKFAQKYTVEQIIGDRQKGVQIVYTPCNYY